LKTETTLSSVLCIETLAALDDGMPSMMVDIDNGGSDDYEDDVDDDENE
jgi:hypothetical protein